MKAIDVWWKNTRLQNSIRDGLKRNHVYNRTRHKFDFYDTLIIIRVVDSETTRKDLKRL